MRKGIKIIVYVIIMKQTIFYLEGRGSQILYHFFVLMLGGLYYIENKQYNVQGTNDSVLMDDTSKHVHEPTTEIKYPIKIHMKDILPYHREAFEIIKDKFELVEDLSKYDDYEIVSVYGETLFKNNYCDHPNEIFGFLRNLFLEKMPKFEMIKGKRIYITRKNSELATYHDGILKRFMENEIEIMEKLKPYGFEYIQLEKLSVFEKIKLFMEAEIILSCYTGALAMLLFSNKETKLIETLRDIDALKFSAYESMCKYLDIKFYRYSNINVIDQYLNYTLEFCPFEEFLQSII